MGVETLLRVQRWNIYSFHNREIQDEWSHVTQLKRWVLRSVPLYYQFTNYPTKQLWVLGADSSVKYADY